MLARVNLKVTEFIDRKTISTTIVGVLDAELSELKKQFPESTHKWKRFGNNGYNVYDGNTLLASIRVSVQVF